MSGRIANTTVTEPSQISGTSLVYITEMSKCKFYVISQRSNNSVRFNFRLLNGVASRRQTNGGVAQLPTGVASLATGINSTA